MPPMQDLSPLVRRGDCIAVQSGTARVAWAGVRAVMKSHGGGSPPLIASEEARGQGCGMGTCKVPASPVSSPSPPPSSLRPRSGLACLQPTVLATPVITTRVAAEEGSRCCGKGIVCSPHGRKEGRKGRTYERMTSAFVGEEDNGDGRQMPQAEREDEWSPRIKFATATAKVYLSPPRLGTQSPPQNENYA